MITGQQLQEYVKSATSLLKGRKREQVAFAVAALCFSVGVGLGEKRLPEFSNGIDWKERLQLALYVIGAISLVYAVVRVWRLVHPPELSPAKDRPSAIKGPMAFTEADGELFRQLGRETELQKLLGLVLDDQILMIVVRGASGAGKTSLLRAGLKHILGDRAIFHYWEALPTEPDIGLLRALQEKWPEGVTKPATLDELVNPVALGRQSHVIVLDQCEQLRGNKNIFQLLRRIIRESKPPHRITWVIAFRREFSADWMDFTSPELERGVRPPQDVSLRLFTAEQALEVIRQLVNESNLKNSIEQAVINNLVEAATVEGEVSPVDIGIGLLVLAELHERHRDKTLTIRDYQFAGGAEGLLTQYINRCLELFPKESQEAILKAMLALRDPQETTQRLAKGATIQELANEVRMDARVLKTQLNRLADRDIRLLEIDSPADSSVMRYRLPHERLIPALYRLTGKLLAEVDQARIKFQNAFQAWKTNDKRYHYLLKAKDLRLIQHYETQIPWGNDEQEKKRFLNRSKRRRNSIRIGIGVGAVILVAAGWGINIQYQQYEHKRYLYETGYPPELYDWQHQLKILKLTAPLDLERFNWLSSDSIEELELHAQESSNSLSGLTSLSNCEKLKNLTLDLRLSEVSDLKPLAQLKKLTGLTLNLNDSRVRDLEPLGQMTGLTQLTLFLDLGQGNDLTPLAQLKGLTQLTLYFNDNQKGGNLTPLAQLNDSQMRVTPPVQLKRRVKDLTLVAQPNDRQMRDLTSLAQLKGLSQLTLDLNDTQVKDLTPLAQLKDLTQLTLDLGLSQVSDLTPLAQLKSLTQLYLSSSQEIDLTPLEQLKGLTQLTLDLGYQVSDLKTLEQLPEMTQLTLYLHAINLTDLISLDLRAPTQLVLDFTLNQEIDLTPLGQLSGLAQLTLRLTASHISDLTPLAQLKELTQLTLYLHDSQVRNLTPLVGLKGLTQLTLDLNDSQVRDLTPLSQLTGLSQLTLFLDLKQVNDLTPLAQLKGLTQLTLILTGSQVSDLKPLEQLTGLTELVLRRSRELDSLSNVKDLETLAGFPQLRSLSIESATNQQRKSLRKIPASLVELSF